jgi:hypothetical protein
VIFLNAHLIVQLRVRDMVAITCLRPVTLPSGYQSCIYLVRAEGSISRCFDFWRKVACALRVVVSFLAAAFFLTACAGINRSDAKAVGSTGADVTMSLRQPAQKAKAALDDYSITVVLHSTLACRTVKVALQEGCTQGAMQEAQARNRTRRSWEQ